MTDEQANVRRPNGSIDRAALTDAATALVSQVGKAEKASAARELLALYRDAGMVSPLSLRSLAGDTSGGMNQAIRTRAGFGS